jgi:two-component system, OmpR family, phosphate regulon response regulator PhoB
VDTAIVEGYRVNRRLSYLIPLHFISCLSLKEFSNCLVSYRKTLQMLRVAVLDDDPSVAVSVSDILPSDIISVEAFERPSDFFYQLKKRPPNCVLIDWEMPQMRGIDVVGKVRETCGKGIGILMISAIVNENRVIEALDKGADDFVFKPTDKRVLRARIEALLRRTRQDFERHKVLEIGRFCLDYENQKILVSGKAVDLSPREFDLAWQFFKSPSRLYTKLELMSCIWGKSSEFGEHTLTQHIYSIRKKLKFEQNDARLISMYGTGYRLEIISAQNSLSS